MLPLCVKILMEANWRLEYKKRNAWVLVLDNYVAQIKRKENAIFVTVIDAGDDSFYVKRRLLENEYDILSIVQKCMSSR